MFVSRLRAGAVVVGAMLFVSARTACAQIPGAVDLRSGWAIGLAPGVWGHVPTDSSDSRPDGKAFDVSLERRIGAASHPGAPAIRVQLGTGEGGDGRKPGFDYRRVTVGLIRTFVGASRSPFSVYVAAGGGAYRLTSSVERSTKPTVSGGIGLDVGLGSSPVSIGADVQVQTIGAAVYGTTSLSARLHLR
jgi:hypothetical protein